MSFKWEFKGLLFPRRNRPSLLSYSSRTPGRISFSTVLVFLRSLFTHGKCDLNRWSKKYPQDILQLTSMHENLESTSRAGYMEGGHVDPRINQ